MRPRSFLEVSIDLLDENGLRLRVNRVSNMAIVLPLCTDMERQPTWILALHSWVMLLILDPETPGAFIMSIDCRIASSSATQDDILVDVAVRNAIYAFATAPNAALLQATDSSHRCLQTSKFTTVGPEAIQRVLMQLRGVLLCTCVKLTEMSPVTESRS